MKFLLLNFVKLVRLVKVNSASAILARPPVSHDFLLHLVKKLFSFPKYQSISKVSKCVKNEHVSADLPIYFIWYGGAIYL